MTLAVLTNFGQGVTKCAFCSP